MDYEPIYGPYYAMHDQNNEWLNNRLEEKEEALVETVEAYLQQSPYYSSETGWKNLSLSGQKAEPDQRQGIKTIVDDILQHFGRTCRFVDTHERHLRNIFIDLNGSEPTYSEDINDSESTFYDSTSSDTNSNNLDFVFASPTHTVLPVVDATRLPNNGCDSSNISDYSRCISILKVTKDTSQETQDSCFTQVADYARQCILQQQHRHYILAILLTEDSIILCHFDQSGVVQSHPHPIHNPESLVDAIRFVRIILRASRNNPVDCGVDPAWFYREGKKWVKIKNNDYKYIETVRHQYSSLGRGSACFIVEGKERESFLVKKYWRHEERVPEYELLKTAERDGVQGVARVIDWDKEGEISTRSFRKGLLSGDVAFSGRIHTCIVQEYYGETIEKYPDPVNLLKAILSAIKVHHDLYAKAGILHHDINASSIVLADPAIHPGLSVVIIDLEMAVYYRTCQRSFKGHDYCTGNLLFQSVALLNPRSSGQHGHASFDQDYLDDLESFIYVLLYLIAEWEKPLEKRKKSLDQFSMIFLWQLPFQAFLRKMDWFRSRRTLHWYLERKEYWNSYANELSDLIASLLGILYPYVERKLEGRDETAAARLRQDIDQSTDSVYSAFVKAFETAIPLVEEIFRNSNSE